jgi:hypothetical protein
VPQAVAAPVPPAIDAVTATDVDAPAPRAERVRANPARPPAHAALPVPAAAARDPIAEAAPRTERSERAAPRLPERRKPPAATPALPSAPSAARPSARTLAQRVAAPRPPPASARSAAPADSRLEGVPLDSLAACVSDADEEQWKRRVLGSVGSRTGCESRAGRYRFVETKNLNAFLMWIERAQERVVGDRCDELALALECLEGGSGGGKP